LEFQEIIEAMMEVDPASRPTIKDLLSNPWLNSIKATDEELTAEIEKRVTKISH
jgi:serine/threonine protein kinase